MITSKQNPLIKEIRSLENKKFRDNLGKYVALGIKLTVEAFEHGQKVECVVCTEEASKSLGELPTQKILVTPEVFETLSEEKTPQGALAVISKPKNQPESPKGKCLFLDGVSDSGNVGAIIRTAAASGYSDVYLTGCADAYSPKAVRASMSGIFKVKTHVGDRASLVKLINLPICVADMNGEDAFKATLPKDFCLVIGSEAHGVSADMRNLAEFTVKIPMENGIESLNAAVSAGILMYALKTKQ